MGERLIISLLTATLAAAIATGVRAADVCQGPPPANGVAVHGPVLAVPDGSSLCVATGPSPSTWVRFSLFHLQTTRPALMAAAFGKNATCVVDAQGRGSCVIEGQSLAATLRPPETADAAKGWR